MSVSAVPRTVPQGVWDQDFASPVRSVADWLLPGFVARNNLTLLTSMWKAGKTTLLAHLLARRVSGAPLLGRPVAPGKTVVISEEPQEFWAERGGRFPFGGQVCLFAQPFAHLPSADEWRGLMERVAELRAEQGVDLLVIDSLTHFMRAESSSAGVLELLLPVRALAAQGMACLLMHHPRRHDAGLGNAGRGHGALHSEVDISIEMRHAGADIDSRARRFFCLSRHVDTPRRLHFELNADGSDYSVLPETEVVDDGFSVHWEVLRMVLEDAPRKLTRLGILAEWPPDFAKPCANTLASWLQSAVSAGLVLKEGTGRKAAPLRYWVAAAEARWRADPMFAFYEMMDRNAKEVIGAMRDGG
jgi:hypothetical protein